MRIGVVGTGVQASTVHLPTLAANEQVELVGIWGRNTEKATALAKQHDIFAEPDLDALLKKVDVISISVPPNVQPDIACRAARAGCHLLLEKPLALSVADATRVVEAVEHAQVASIVAPWGFTQLKSFVTWYASVIEASEWYFGSARIVAALRSPASPYANVSSPWRDQYGALWDAGPHALDALLAGLGPVEEVVAQRGFGDTVHLALRHHGAKISSATVSLTAPEAAQHFGVEFWGPAGLVRPPKATSPDEADPSLGMTERAVSDLIRSIETGVPGPRDARWGAEIVRILEAAERFLNRDAASRGEPVP